LDALSFQFVAFAAPFYIWWCKMLKMVLMLSTHSFLENNLA